MRRQKTTGNELARFTYKGVVIRDEGDMLNLTDMWRAAGADMSKRPPKWLESEQAIHFIEFLRVKSIVQNSDHELIRTVRGGTDPHTKAHWQIGLAYAKYLEPAFHVWCNEVVRAEMEGTRQVHQQVMAGEVVIALADMVVAIGNLAKSVGAMVETNNRRLDVIERTYQQPTNWEGVVANHSNEPTPIPTEANGFRKMNSKFKSKCMNCNGVIGTGDPIMWKARYGAHCAKCSNLSSGAVAK